MEDGYAVLLDGKPMRTPAKAGLAVKSRKLAEAMAEEWQTQGEEIKPDDLHLTRLAGTAIDLIEPRRAQIIAEIAKYAATDLALLSRGESTRTGGAPACGLARTCSIGQDRVTRPLAVTPGIAPLRTAAHGSLKPHRGRGRGL